MEVCMLNSRVLGDVRLRFGSGEMLNTIFRAEIQKSVIHIGMVQQLSFKMVLFTLSMKMI